MKYSITLLLFSISLGLIAQSGIVISESYVDQPVDEVFQDISEKHALQFYYERGWIDSLKVTKPLTGQKLESALDDLFEGTTLNYYQDDNKLILLNNVVIIEEPGFMEVFTEELTSEELSTRGLVFSREYSAQSSDKSDLENYVFEIGNRTQTSNSGKATLAGYVTDEETGESIEGAFVFVQNPMIGTTSDGDGFYSLSLPHGKHKIYIQFSGMKTTFRNVILFSNGKLDISMDVDVIALQEVTVSADRDENINNVQMGVSKISTEEVKTVPIVLGENDILKIATTKAGVQNVGEGASGFNVRGGKTDQNLVLFGGAPVYNTSHFFGFFSVFNSDAIRNMEVYKSSIPAKYGGRLSSVFDISSKEPDKTTFHGEGGISPITSKLTLEIPIIKEKTSLLLSGRTTYSNWVLKRAKSANFSENEVSFYDIIAKVDHQINEKNDLTFSTYMSSDDFRLSSDTLFSFSNFGYKNFNSSIKCDHDFSTSLVGSLSSTFTRYSYAITYDESIPNGFEQDFDLTEGSIAADLNYYPSEVLTLNAGMSSKLYNVNPGSKTPLTSESIVKSDELSHEKGLETALYASSQYNLNEDLQLYAGLRYVVFNALGPKDVYQYLSGSPKNGETINDSINFTNGAVIKTYHGPEWRFSARYTLNSTSSVKAGISRTKQYIHSLSNSASLSPTDTWRLSGYHLMPQSADQVSLGYFKNLFRNTIEVSVEGYYKWMDNLVDFKTGADFLLNENIERVALQGPGKSYGLEFSLNKSGRLNGWINYAYARTFIKLDGTAAEETVNEGQYFPTAYDKPHTINLVANYKLTRRLSFSINSTYNTGRPVTVPVAGFNFMGSQNINFSDRNSFRIPDYFRIDLGINLEGNHKIEKLSHSFWSLSIYNLTGRDNPFSVFFDVKDGEIKGSQLIVFGDPVPTLSYNFKF